MKPAPDNREIPPHHSRKNTRRWCKGVVGREHIDGPVVFRSYNGWRCQARPIWWGRYSTGRRSCYEWITCAACGKYLRQPPCSIVTDEMVSAQSGLLHPRYR